MAESQLGPHHSHKKNRRFDAITTMTTRSEKEKQKQMQEKCQSILSQLLRDEDNKYCVDCDAKGPRWAAWNLGIFLCIRCAGIHRNLGVHISKVKSVNLDTWTPEQVASLQQMGNSRARAVYEANLPDNFRRPQTDSSLEAFVRAKYEQKKYIAKEWVPPPVPKPAFEIDDFDSKKKSHEKKSRLSSKGGEVSTPNAIPAPKLKSTSSSAASKLVSTIEPTSNKTKSKNDTGVDLLGLDDLSTVTSSSSSNDLFGSFLSADTNPSPTTINAISTPVEPQPELPKTSEPENPSEEENFFSQPEDLNKKQQLTKESILSLYGQSSAPQPTMFAVPGNMYAPQTFPAQPIGVNFTSHPQQSPMGVMPNGIMGNPAMQPAVMPSGGVVVGNNPFLNPAMSGYYSATTNMVPPNPTSLGQFDLSSASDLMTWNSDSKITFSPTNPFIPHEPQLQQQMTSMSLAGRQTLPQSSGISWSNQPTGHTLSTNLWQ